MLVLMLSVGLVLVGALALRGWRLRRGLEHEVAALRESARLEAGGALRNRAAFLEDLELELMRTARTGRPASLVVLALAAEHWSAGAPGVPSERAASAIRSAVRHIDIGYRVAADEFALILPETRARGALVAVRRIADRLVSGGFAEEGLRVGIAELGPGTDSRDVFRQAYCALLASGQDGRARIVAYSEELESGRDHSDLSGLREIEASDGQMV